MDNRDAVAMISGNLEAAKLRKQDAIEQMFAATHEVAQLECDLRNTQRRTNDTRPLESAGRPDCVHQWHGDPVNVQHYCSCGARFDVDMLGPETLLADVFPDPPQFVGPVQLLKPMSLEEFSAICDSVDGKSEAIPDLSACSETSVEGWESVATGGFGEGCNDKFPEPLIKQALDDAVAMFRSDNTQDSPEVLAAMEEMRGGSGLNPGMFAGLAASADAGDDWGDGVGGASGPSYVPIPESDGKLEGALIGAFLKATPPHEVANKWAEQG